MSDFTVDLDLRADETSAFVPSDLVPGAAVGDAVTVRSSYLAGERTGTVAEIVDDASRGRFHRVTFEEVRTPRG
jgi:hypothetical protein